MYNIALNGFKIIENPLKPIYNLVWTSRACEQKKNQVVCGIQKFSCQNHVRPAAPHRGQSQSVFRTVSTSEIISNILGNE